MMITALAICMLGLILRLRYLRLPLDWDHGLLLYQSYWYVKLGKFIAGWRDYEPAPPTDRKARAVTTQLEECSIIRFQTIGFSTINILTYLICRDRVWAYRMLDTFFSLLVSTILFLWGMRLFDASSAALGASLFFLFSAMPFYWGAMDNPEKFQILFTFSALLCMTMGLQTSELIYGIPAGILFFIAMTFKQNVGFVILFALIYVVIQGGFLAAGVLVATLLACYAALFLYYGAKGYPFKVIFDRVFISVDAFFYLFQVKADKETGQLQKAASYNLLARLLPNLKNNLKESSLLWVMSLIWFIAAIITDTHAPALLLMGLVLIGTLLAFFTANKFFPYYYLPFLPITALTSGDLYQQVFNAHDLFSLPVLGLLALTAALTVLAIRTTYRFFFRSSSFEQGSYMYANTLYNFGASEEIGRYIRQHTAPQDSIYVFNLNPEIYFFSQRKCPTNALYVDTMTTVHFSPANLAREEEAIRQKLKAASPAYVVINKSTNMPIEFFEQVTGRKYFLEKEYHAGFDPAHHPVTLQLFRQCQPAQALPHITAGEELFAQDRIAEAMAAFELALAYDPLNSDALNNLGVCHYRQGDQAKAVALLVRALQVNPANRDVALNLLDMDFSVEDKLKILTVYLSSNPQDEEIRQIHTALQSSGKKS